MPEHASYNYGSEGYRFNSYWVRHFKKVHFLANTPKIPTRYFMAEKLKKVEGERFLYLHAVSKVYYLRKRTETEDTYVSLKTTKKSMAVDLRDRWLLGQASQRLGLEDTKPKLKRLRIDRALGVYEKAGFPSMRRGKLQYPGDKHLRTEEDAVKTLCGFFKTKHVDELDADLLDDYHDWRKENVKDGAGGDRTTDLELNTFSKSLDWSHSKKAAFDQSHFTPNQVLQPVQSSPQQGSGRVFHRGTAPGRGFAL
jgi:hypothetical protein